MRFEPNYGVVSAGDVVAYRSISSYGYKLLQPMKIEGVTYWLTEHGNVREGEWKTDGTGLSIISLDRIKDAFIFSLKAPLFSKGDLLEAMDSNGNRVLFIYEHDDRVHRITPGGSYTSDGSWASLETYQREFGTLAVLETKTYPARPFSKL